MTHPAARILAKLYREESKHSNYQELPSALRPLLNEAGFTPKTRCESARLKFIRRHMNIPGQRILDIGANTGFFTFELLAAGATNAILYEGNEVHARFASMATKFLGLENRISVVNAYFDTENPGRVAPVDITLLLNVLHHLGDDYGHAGDRDQAKQRIATSLTSFAEITDKLVFQLGFNWKGDRHLPLFEHGTKHELISFVEDAIAGHWSIDAIGIAEKLGDRITYQPPTDSNLRRQDELGEFLNRPLFILTSNHRKASCA